MVSIFVKLNFKHFLLYKISLGSTSISNGNGSGPPQRFIYLSLSTYFHCWSRKWLLTPVFLPGKFCGQRSLAGYSPWNCNRVRHNFREGNGTPLQYSCLENPKDRGAWWAAVHGVSKSQTRLSDFTFTFHFHALEKEMATHSSVCAWRIPGMGEPGGLPSMGSHRVGHDRSDLAEILWLCYKIHYEKNIQYLNVWLHCMSRSIQVSPSNSGFESFPSFSGMHWLSTVIISSKLKIWKCDPAILLTFVPTLTFLLALLMMIQRGTELHCGMQATRLSSGSESLPDPRGLFSSILQVLRANTI